MTSKSFNASLDEAHSQGRCGCRVGASKSNYVRLFRWAKRKGIQASGFNIEGDFIVLFWGRMLGLIEKQGEEK